MRQLAYLLHSDGHAGLKFGRVFPGNEYTSTQYQLTIIGQLPTRRRYFKSASRPPIVRIREQVEAVERLLHDNQFTHAGNLRHQQSRFALANSPMDFS